MKTHEKSVADESGSEMKRNEKLPKYNVEDDMKSHEISLGDQSEKETKVNESHWWIRLKMKWKGMKSPWETKWKMTLKVMEFLL